MGKDKDLDLELDESEGITPQQVIKEALYGKLLAEHPDGLAYLNDDGEYVFVNSKGEIKK